MEYSFCVLSLDIVANSIYVAGTVRCNEVLQNSRGGYEIVEGGIGGCTVKCQLNSEQASHQLLHELVCLFLHTLNRNGQVLGLDIRDGSARSNNKRLGKALDVVGEVFCVDFDGIKVSVQVQSADGHHLQVVRVRRVGEQIDLEATGLAPNGGSRGRGGGGGTEGD